MKKALSRFIAMFTGFFSSSQAIDSRTEMKVVTTQGQESKDAAKDNDIEAFNEKIKNGETVRLTGVVKWFNDDLNYGFVILDGVSCDAYVHRTAIQAKRRYDRTLDEGQPVLVDVSHSHKSSGLRVVRCIRVNTAANDAFERLAKQA